MSSSPKLKPFLKHPPDWVYDDPRYQDLKWPLRAFLFLVAGQCDVPMADGSKRGCYAMARLEREANISESTRDTYLKKLRAAGFVVKVGQGGGRLPDGRTAANEYALPISRGALDDIALDEDGRFITNTRGNKPSRNKAVHRDALPSRFKGVASQDATEANESDPVDLQGKPRRIEASTQLTSRSNPPVVAAPNSHHHKKEILKINTHTDAIVLHLNDDDRSHEDILEPQDDAGLDQVVAVLSSHGVSRRRATKIASRVTPAQVREGLRRCQGRSIDNLGGYLADTIENVLAEAIAKERARRVDEQDRKAEVYGSLDDQIQEMSDAEILELFKRTGNPMEGMQPKHVRNSVWRPSLLRQLEAELESEVSDVV